MLSSPMDDLLLEAIAEVAGTQIAFSNGWRYGAPVPAGPITLGDLWNMVPTNPPVSLTEVTGAEIRQMIEENLERTFAAEPYDQMGGYIKRIRGVDRSDERRVRQKGSRTVRSRGAPVNKKK